MQLDYRNAYMNISVCIITKNEITKLSRCLDALSAYPFEIVVVDTGSTDGTREMIEERADVSGDFTWVDDFAKARNYCVSLAHNDWILSLDSDEFITNIDLESLSKFITENELNLGRIDLVNIIPSVNSSSNCDRSHEKISRFFNRKHFHFSGHIHEQLVSIDGHVPDYIDVPISIDHDGYNQSMQELTRKAERNISLLLKELENAGEDSYILYQLGKSYFLIKNYEKAFEYFERGLNLAVNPSLEYVGDMIETYGYTLLELGRYNDMLLLENVYEDLSESADYVFLMGLAYMNNALFDRAIEEFIKATALKSCKVEGINSYKAFFNAGVIKECLGFIDEACVFYEKCGDYAPARERLFELFSPTESDFAIAGKQSSQKEIVFLPYKASMWDSLEGAYRKALTQKDCSVKVIPIPYFDKNPDGSIGTMHWEINEYPSDVEVISYKGYDLSLHHPAEIYIHNPYDEGNHVTTIYPYYYSKNLKNFTDKLVYIPYFVLEEFDSSILSNVEALSHLAQVPAVINADLVIVQSENIRNFYVESMVLAGGENLRDYFNKKIIAGGSSKIDKVKNLHDTDYTLPEEWNNVIYSKDGRKKKVILYNTSLSAFLNSSDEMLIKIKNTLDFFKNNTDKTALLWRPHPLLESTIKSMRPDLLDDYHTIISEYCRDNWGIFDDSSDLDRAIAISDAYYGDHSSLVVLCKEKGMPIMIQNVNVLN